MMKRALLGRLALFAAVASSVAACGGTQVRRIDPETTTDLSGYWNDTDSRIVADDMIQDCLGHPWIQQFVRANEAKPVVIVADGYARLTSNPAISVSLTEPAVPLGNLFC